ncbi:transposase [Streptomyces piniterrae]|uniref:Transposase n=1 Tax=Streptomyces piniterrae TaxID=2571125 RepID=A0A4U0NWI9_9ACTN|nr:transposase [Streptomyces piniterrae]
MHVLSDANGLPLRVGLSAASTHDSQALKPMLSHFHMGHESHATDSKPGRLHADKAYRRSSPAEMTVGQAHRRPHRPQGQSWAPRRSTRSTGAIPDSSASPATSLTMTRWPSR